MNRRASGPNEGENIRRDVAAYLQEARPPPTDVLEMEFVFDALAHPRRRYVPYSLLAGTRWTLKDLATKLVAWEHDIRADAVVAFDREEMFVSLYHVHVPKLVDHDVVEYRAGAVPSIVPGDNALEGIGAGVDAVQEVHARNEFGEE